MYIDNDIKLDFKDVLIKPKRSNLNSRSDVTLERKFTFKHSSVKWQGIPIMVANMDTTGTFEMATAVHNHKIFTCIHKYYTIEEWKSFRDLLSITDISPSIYNYMAVSSGSKEEDLERMKQILTPVFR